jgi:hypothetical protein
MARWRRFHAAFADFSGSVLARQVHGTELLWHQGPPRGWHIFEGADGHLTATPGLLLLVTVADCVPVYLAAPEYRAVALLHAGWRGTAGGILARGVAELTSRTGCDASDIVMHCGVAISGPCYEVGSEVVSALGQALGGPGPWQVDLRAALCRQAADLGIGEVTVSDHCTAREADHFFSHRRSHGADGRMIAWLGYPVGVGRTPLALP